MFLVPNIGKVDVSLAKVVGLYTEHVFFSL